MEDAVTIAFSNLRSAKHRFENSVTHLSRFCLKIGCCIRLLVKVILLRPESAAAGNAKRFLEVLDEEMIVQAAMLADAADEGLLLVRNFDTIGPDPAMQAQWSQYFIASVLSNVL